MMFRFTLLLACLLVVIQAAPPKRRLTPWHRNFTRPNAEIGKVVARWSPEDGGNPEELGPYFEGDIMMPETPLPLTRNGVDYPHLQWVGGVVPYVFDATVVSTHRSTIMTAIWNIQNATCVRFVPRTNEVDYVLIQSLNTGCWSYVGRKGGMQELNLQNPGCTSVGTTMHEMMHALGFFHEHTRDDRDQHVIIQWANIQTGKENNFDIWPYRKSVYGVGYDYGSILHYSATSFSSNSQPTIVTIVPNTPIGQRAKLSNGDITRMNGMYCASGK